MDGISNSTLEPSDLPIQFFCNSFTLSGQSTSSNPLRRDSAYSVIRKTHCFIGLRITGCPPLSDFPSITSSLANTVPNSGHQFTGTSS